MVIAFNQATKLVLDNIAPLKIKVLSDKGKSPWLRDEVIRRKKRDCRRAEHKWRKTQLPEHFNVYKTLLFNYNSEIKVARQAYFKYIINNNTT